MLPWIRYYRCWEPEVAAVLRSLLRPGMTFVDLGAHVGYHTLIGARSVQPHGKVIAVEPEPTNFALLEANIAAHGLTNTRAIQAAAWRAPGFVGLEVSSDNSGDHRAFPQEIANQNSVPAIVIDEFVAAESVVDVIKSDLQGRDHIAIEGTENTINRCHPVLLVEFWPFGIRSLGDDPSIVCRYYRALGYKVSVVELPDLGSDVDPDIVMPAADNHPQEFLTLLLTPR